MPVVGAHLFDQRGQLFQLFVVDAQRRERAGLALDGAPRFEKLEGPMSLTCSSPGGGRRFLTYTRAQSHVYQAVELDRDDGLAHGGTGDLEGLRQLAFGRQAIADLVDPVLDGLGQLAGNAFVQAAGFGHRRLSIRRRPGVNK